MEEHVQALVWLASPPCMHVTSVCTSDGSPNVQCLFFHYTHLLKLCTLGMQTVLLIVLFQGVVYFLHRSEILAAINHKIFAIEEDDLVRGVAGPSTGSAWKRRRTEQLAPELYIDNVLAPLTEKVEMLVRDMDGIKDQLNEVFAVTKETKVSLALKRSINATFAWKICTGVITPQ